MKTTTTSFNQRQQSLEAANEDMRRGGWRAKYHANADGTYRYTHGDAVMCAARGCCQHATYMSEYSYFSGRRGNISRREILHCEEHAMQFREKYRLD